MSYEGYTEILCTNGHLSCLSCWDEWRDTLSYSDEINPAPFRCHCGAKAKFSHEVDETNNEPQPYLFEIESEARTEVCNLGHIHYVEQARYKIPIFGAPN